MLVLISIGLYDERDMSIKALETARSCDLLFAEFYTTKLNTTVEKLEELIGKPIRLLSRQELEERQETILNEAKIKKVGLLVGGDCLVATTHSSLVLEAKKQGISTHVVHSSSIISAVAETGLHLQKFGPYVTIPFLEKTKGLLPESVYRAIQANKNRGLHTLCLLDTDNRCMTVKEALSILLQLEENLKENVLSKDLKVIACSKLGGGSLIEYDTVESLLEKDFETPSVIIIPGSLHFTEKEFISSLCSSEKR